MKVSLDFNLGVIEAKFVEGLERGEKYLANAIRGAHQLGDYEQERKAWWELGNVCKKNGDLERAIRCQQKELQLVEKHNNTDEKILCLIEISKQKTAGLLITFTYTSTFSQDISGVW